MGLGRRASFSHPSYHMVGGGVGSPPFMPSGPAYLHPCQKRQLNCAAQVKCRPHSLTCCSWRGSMPVLPLSRPWGHPSHQPPAAGVGEGGGILSLVHSTTWQMGGWGLISHTCWQGWQSYAPFKRVSSNMLPRSGAGSAFQNSAAGEGQGQLSHSLDPGRAFAACSRWGKG